MCTMFLMLRIFNVKRMTFIFLLMALFLLFQLQYEQDKIRVCSRCRIVSFEYSDAPVGGDVVDDLSLALSESVSSLYVKQVDVEEDGEVVMNYDQFVLEGLVELSSIRKSADNIFFVEGSCLEKTPRGGDLQLGCREACGVEAAARAHPSSPVFVLHSCSLAEDFALSVPEHSRALLRLPNVYIVDLDFAELSGDWPSTLPFLPTPLGLLALWKYGGTYLSFDTLVLRPLYPLISDYCGYSDDKVSIGGGVLNFRPFGYGHSLLTAMLKAYSNDFDRGAAIEDASVLTNTVDMECSKLPKTLEECNRFTIFDSDILFPVGYRDIILLSNNSVNSLKEFLSTIKETAYAMSYFDNIDHSYEDSPFESTQFFNTIMKDVCPSVYKTCKHRYF